LLRPSRLGERVSLTEGEYDDAIVVPIDLLRPADSPRQAGEDEAHTRRLAESDAVMPPILVHRQTMRVIDGMHRLRSAERQGRCTIAVRFFDGDEADAFVLGVEENIRHGMPLSLTDRRAAARRIFESHPDMSDRAVAHSTGLSARTVGALRRSTAELPQLNERIGADGRRRPVNGKDGRRRAAEALLASPEASLREISRQAKVSLGTAHDVRRRLNRGEDPVHPPASPRTLPDQPDDLGQGTNAGGLNAELLDTSNRLRKLQADPTLKYSEAGRELIRWLSTHMRADAKRSHLVEAIPPHLVPVVREVARHCAESWTEFARDLQTHERRMTAVSSPEPDLSGTAETNIADRETPS